MKRLSYVLLLIVLTGCVGKGDAVTIEFWAMGREGEVVSELVPEFERRHPGIRVEVQQVPWSAAHEKMLTAYAGDATPDISQLGSTWISEFVALEALEPLDVRIATSALVDSADYFAGSWATNVLGGRVYGVPWYVDTRLLFYRKDILRRAGYDHPPRTWDEWEEVLQAVKAEVGEDAYAILLPTNEFEPPIIFALQQDDGMLRDGGRYGNFRSDAFRRAFTFYIDMFEKGWAPRMTNTEISNVWQEFARGFYSFYITGPWNIGEFGRRLPDSLQDDWMTAPMPGPEAYPGTSTAGGASLVLFRDTQHPDPAWQFVEYLSAPEQQVRFHELTGNLPARMTAWQDSALATNPYAQAFELQLRHVESPPQVPEWERIATMIREYAERVVNGRMTVDQALAGLDHDVDQLLEKRRWMLANDE